MTSLLRLLWATISKRLTLILLALVGVLAAAVLWQHERANRAAERASVAEAARDEAQGALKAYEANEAKRAALDKIYTERAAALDVTTEQVVRYVYRDRPALPPVCDAALDPVRDAVDGVRKLRAQAASQAAAAEH